MFTRSIVCLLFAVSAASAQMAAGVGSRGLITNSVVPPLSISAPGSYRPFQPPAPRANWYQPNGNYFGGGFYSPFWNPDDSYTTPIRPATVFPEITPAPVPAAAPAIAVDARSALITLDIPAEAIVKFQGQLTGQTGRHRYFVTPFLAPGQSYTVEIQVSWKEAGKDVDQKIPLEVRAGDRKTVTLLRAG